MSHVSNELLEIDAAWDLIRSHLPNPGSEALGLDQSVGRRLAKPVHSDIDSPPFDKSLVDGFAISEWDPSKPDFQVIETVTAGNVPSEKVSAGNATRIMTGSPIPQGALGVVMVEETEETEPDRVTLRCHEFNVGQNVLRRGRVVERHQVLAEPGKLISAKDIGALAEFGCTNLELFRQPSVSILTTGDELVEPDQNPGPGQIRNSNGALLVELSKSAGGKVTNLGIGRDQKDDLTNKIKEGLNSDLLIIAGGVSAGKLDLIPQCLAECGVTQIFHKLNLKPGKPLWFGKSQDGVLVFGLPGNPVSSLVCFRLFVKPVISQVHESEPWVVFGHANLSSDFEFNGGRRTYWPFAYEPGSAELIKPLNWKGSADQVTFLGADGLIDLGEKSHHFKAGDTVKVIHF